MNKHYYCDCNTDVEKVEIKPIVTIVVVDALEDHCGGIHTVHTCHRNHMISLGHKFGLVHCSNHVSAAGAKAHQEIVANCPIDVFGPNDEAVSTCLNEKTHSVGDFPAERVGYCWSNSCGYCKAKEVS